MNLFQGRQDVVRLVQELDDENPRRDGELGCISGAPGISRRVQSGPVQLGQQIGHVHDSGNTGRSVDLLDGLSVHRSEASATHGPDSLAVGLPSGLLVSIGLEIEEQRRLGIPLEQDLGFSALRRLGRGPHGSVGHSGGLCLGGYARLGPRVREVRWLDSACRLGQLLVMLRLGRAKANNSGNAATANNSGNENGKNCRI